MLPFGSQIFTAPSVEPLSLEETKLHCKVDDDADDDLITGLIFAARNTAENYLSMRLVTQTWDFYFDCFPGNVGEIEIPYGKLQSVTTLKYTDSNNIQQTLSDTLYQIDTKKPRGRIRPVHSAVWPSLYPNAYNRVEIRAVLGFGLAADVPKNIKQALLMMILHWYDNRSDVEVGTIVAEVPFASKMLLAQERAYYFA